MRESLLASPYGVTGLSILGRLRPERAKKMPFEPVTGGAGGKLF
jgi:hypothetical protein